MASIRRSKNLKQFSNNLLYEVPAGKSASLSVAFLNPKKTTLFVQTDTANTEFSLSDPIAEVVLTGNDVTTDIGLSLFSSPLLLSLHAVSSTLMADSSSNITDPIGYVFGYTTDINPAERIVLKPAAAGSYTKCCPILDYEANPSLSNGAMHHSASGGRFLRDASQDTAIRNPTFGTYSTFYAYEEAGGAIYDNYSFGVTRLGYVSSSSALTMGAVNASYGSVTSQGGSVSPYGIAVGSSRQIQPGSPQVFFINGSAFFWVSSFSSSSTPLVVATNAVNITTPAWQNFGTTTFTGSVNNERLLWCRFVGSYYFTGGNKGRIYNNSAFGGAHSAISTPPADVNIEHPPIRIAANKLAFASLAGTGIYHIMTGGATPTWSTASSSFPYEENELLAATYAAAGITPILSVKTGERSVDLTVFTTTDKYTTSVPFDTRAADVDLVPELSANAERTNLVLAAGDKLYAYTEAADTIIHVYGYEE
jgi:hypothetical protein